MLRSAPSPEKRWRVAAPLALICWLIAAGLGNLAVPQLEQVVATHSRAFLPADAPSSVAAARSAQQMGGGTGDNLDYVVLERGNGIVAADREYYGRLVDALRADRPTSRRSPICGATR